MHDDDSWRDREEVYLTKLESQCNLYEKYFNSDYLYYHKLSAKFNIPILMISALNALCAIALNDFLPQRFVSIMNAVLSSGTGVLGSIQLYMKINEKMTNATRSQMLMKRLALKISKELSIDRDKRASDGQIFLQECFSEFNAALEQANILERKVKNFMLLDKDADNDNDTSSSLYKFAGSAMGMLSPRKTNSIIKPLPPVVTTSTGPTNTQTENAENIHLVSNRRELPFEESPHSPYNAV